MNDFFLSLCSPCDGEVVAELLLLLLLPPGTLRFLSSVAVHGLAGTQLQTAREAERAQVAAAVQRGLDSGAVQPLLAVRVARDISDMELGAE